MFGFDADSGVGNRNPQETDLSNRRRFLLNSDAHVSARGGIAYGIDEQVEENLCHSIWVYIDCGRVSRTIKRDFNAFPRRRG